MNTSNFFLQNAIFTSMIESKKAPVQLQNEKWFFKYFIIVDSNLTPPPHCASSFAMQKLKSIC